MIGQTVQHYADRSPWMAYVKTDLALAELRGDPRLRDLLRRLRLDWAGASGRPRHGCAMLGSRPWH